jgi:hypothetical protein
MFVLSLAIFKIRRFYRENKLSEKMNTKAMVIHVLTFGGFVLSATVLNALIIYTLVNPYDSSAFNDVYIVIIPVLATATIAQSLLCVIFWQFGGKLEA